MKLDRGQKVVLIYALIFILQFVTMVFGSSQFTYSLVWLGLVFSFVAVPAVVGPRAEAENKSAGLKQGLKTKQGE